MHNFDSNVLLSADGLRCGESSSADDNRDLSVYLDAEVCACPVFHMTRDDAELEIELDVAETCFFPDINAEDFSWPDLVCDEVYNRGIALRSCPEWDDECERFLAVAAELVNKLDVTATPNLHAAGVGGDVAEERENRGMHGADHGPSQRMLVGGSSADASKPMIGVQVKGDDKVMMPDKVMPPEEVAIILDPNHNDLNMKLPRTPWSNRRLEGGTVCKKLAVCDVKRLIGPSFMDLTQKDIKVLPYKVVGDVTRRGLYNSRPNKKDAPGTQATCERLQSCRCAMDLDVKSRRQSAR